MRTNIQFILKIVKTNQKSGTNHNVLRDCATLLQFIIKLGTFAYLLVGFAFYTLPLLIYFYTNETSYILYTFAPLLDENTYVGYISLYIYHGSLVILAINGSIASDFLFSFMVINYWPITKIFHFEIQALNRTLLRFNQEKYAIQRKIQLRNILLQHQDIVKYTNY